MNKSTLLTTLLLSLTLTACGGGSDTAEQPAPITPPPVVVPPTPEPEPAPPVVVEPEPELHCSAYTEVTISKVHGVITFDNNTCNDLLSVTLVSAAQAQAKPELHQLSYANVYVEGWGRDETILVNFYNRDAGGSTYNPDMVQFIWNEKLPVYSYVFTTTYYYGDDFLTKYNHDLGVYYIYSHEDEYDVLLNLVPDNIILMLEEALPDYKDYL